MFVYELSGCGFESSCRTKGVVARDSFMVYSSNSTFLYSWYLNVSKFLNTIKLISIQYQEINDLISSICSILYYKIRGIKVSFLYLIARNYDVLRWSSMLGKLPGATVQIQALQSRVYYTHCHIELAITSNQRCYKSYHDFKGYNGHSRRDYYID